MARVAILDDYQDVARNLADWNSFPEGTEVWSFTEHLDREDSVANRLKDFDVVVVMRERTPFPRTQMEKLPNLKLLVTTGMRNLSIDLAAAQELGITVCGTRSLGHPTSEFTWGLILALLRHLPEEDREMRRGGWQTTVGTSIRDKVLGIVGLGAQGGRVATVGKAFGMDVVAWSENLTEERCAEFGVKKLGKDALLTRSDIVSIHQVLSDRTRGLIGARELGLMKPSAVLINTSRGPIVDEPALIEALKTGKIAGAAVDVYDTEPLPTKHPLRRLDNLLLTPHLGYVTEENYREMYSQAVEGINAYFNGAPVRVLESS